MNPHQNSQIEKRKREIVERIRHTSKLKRKIINKSHQLVSDYNSKKISKEEYQKRLKKGFEGKTPQQWIDYYNQHIKIYEQHLDSLKIKKSKQTLIKTLTISVVVLLLIIMGLIIYAQITKLPPSLAPEDTFLLSMENSYSPGETLKGNMQIMLKRGELIPSSTEFIINNVEEINSYLLSDLISSPTNSGNYYLEDFELVESGEGYGIKGEKTTYPNVSFTMEITSQLIILPPTSTGEKNADTSNQTQGNETLNESLKLAPPEKTFTMEVEGTVSAITPFTYPLNNDVISVEIISSSQPVSLTTTSNTATITTAYSETSQGFGQDFLMEEPVKLNLNITQLNLSAKQGIFDINLSYENTLFISLKESISLEINETDFTSNTTQQNATLNENVKWKKKINLNQPKEIKINIPKESTNIKVYKYGIEIQIDIQDKSNSKEIIINDDALEYDIDYETSAPLITEEEIIGNKKRIKVSGSSDPNVHYENVLISTTIPEILNIRDPNIVKIYWVEQGIYLSPKKVEDTDFNEIYDSLEFIAPQLSNQTFEITINVLNIQSYPIVDGNWTVEFNTTGTANLTIRAINETTWSNIQETEDLKFLEIKCGSQILTSQWTNNEVFIEDYNCNDEIGSETSKVLTTGVHNLEFEFGGQKVYANNDAGDYEVGLVSDVNGWTVVNLANNYISPVVVVTGQQGADISMDVEASRPIIRNIQSTSFEVLVMNDQGTIVTENVGYIVVEEGHWTIEGVEVEAGLYTVSNAVSQTITFSQAFPDNTVVVDTIQEETLKTMTSRYNENSMTSTSYDVLWEDYNLNGQFDPGTATAGYIAIELGAASSLFESGIYDECTADPGDGQWCQINFANTYPSTPILFTNPVEGGGGDPTVMGRQTLTTTGVNLRPTEDRVTDTEQGHANNDLPWIVWTSNSPPTDPTDITCNGGSCDITINNNVILQASGSIDPELDTITYFLEAELETGDCTNAGSCAAILDSDTCSSHSEAGCSWDSGGTPQTNTVFSDDGEGWAIGNCGGAGNPWDSCDIDETGSNGDLAVNVNPHSGSYAIRADDFDSPGVPYALQKTLDLSSCDRIYVEFYWYGARLDSGEYGRFSINDGSWQTLLEIDGNNQQSTSDNTPVSTDYTLFSSEITGNYDFSSPVTFAWGYQMNGGGEVIYYDDLKINCETDGSPECEGTLDCPAYSNELSCEVSQCSWDITKQWTQIGNHAEGSSFDWNTLLITKQTDINLRARTIDLTGSNTYSNYYTENPTSPYLEIDHGANNPPVITYISPVDEDGFNLGVVDPVAGQSVTAYVWFIAEDADGESNLNSFSGTVEFNYGGTTRPGTCSEAPACDQEVCTGNQKNYSCSVNMNYYDSPSSSWNVEISVSDLGAYQATCGVGSSISCTTFEYTSVTGITNDPSINWDSLDITATDQPGDGTLSLFNRGNIALTNIRIESFNLEGQTTPSQTILSERFSVGSVVGGSDSGACDIGGAGTQMLPDGDAGQPVTIQGLTIPYGAPGSDEEELFFCIWSNLEDLGLSTQQYSSTSPWSITVLLVSVTAARKRRKKKSASQKAKILEFLDENFEDLVELVKQNKIKTKTKNIEIPLDIFNKGISPAEAICKYLKENKNLKFNEIALAINRDQRTTWVNYRNASKKLKVKIKTKEKTRVPINIFSNRNLSILESLIHYLKESGLSNKIISKKIGKSQSNIWTIYSRTTKKLNQKQVLN